MVLHLSILKLKSTDFIWVGFSFDVSKIRSGKNTEKKNVEYGWSIDLTNFKSTKSYYIVGFMLLCDIILIFMPNMLFVLFYNKCIWRAIWNIVGVIIHLHLNSWNLYLLDSSFCILDFYVGEGEGEVIINKSI